jgi:hypothetical protein
MRDWRAMTQLEIRDYFFDFGHKIRSNALMLGRRAYVLSLAQGVWQALHCNYEHLAAVELGVFTGAGLRDLCTAAEFFREEFGLDIRVYGFDRGSGSGLPPPTGDYRDNPELYHAGAFPMPDQEALRASLPAWCELVIGDVGETIPAFLQRLEDRRLAFAAFDLDLYSSTTRALPLLAGRPEQYVPAVPLYFDDTNNGITQSDWTGERLAVLEFNEAHALRKISWPLESRYRIHNLYVLQVLDHPIRQGKERPRYGFQIGQI